MLGTLLGRHHRQTMTSGENCYVCHQFSPSAKDVRAALDRTADLEEALATAVAMIEANPGEDTCRHLTDVWACNGEDDEPCIDRARRELIRAAVAPSGVGGSDG